MKTETVYSTHLHLQAPLPVAIEALHYEGYIVPVALRLLQHALKHQTFLK